jgi:hypothetical protein
MSLWPFVSKKKYNLALSEAAAWETAYDSAEDELADMKLQAMRTPTTAVTVSDTQVQQVVAAIDRAADEIVAAVRSST